MEINENAPGNISQKGGKGGTTDNESGHDPDHEGVEVPLDTDDEAPVEEEMSDVDANNSVSEEHPQP